MTKAVWNPSNDYIKNTRLYELMQQSGYSNYDDYYKHTIKDISSFWDQAVKALDIQWYQDYDEVVNLDKGIMYPEWFVNGK